MRQFLETSRDELILRCREKVASRPRRSATNEQLANGVPLFLEQLTRTLLAEERGEGEASLKISGAATGNNARASEIGESAAIHGSALQMLGYTIDQVVHDYGDLCQAITDLAVEHEAPFSVDQFRTLNRCLDNAIADAVTAFATERDVAVARQVSLDQSYRLGFLVHELRNHLHIAKLGFDALQSGRLATGGSTAGMVKRNLDALEALLAETIQEVKSGDHVGRDRFPVASMIEEVRLASTLRENAKGCVLNVSMADPGLFIQGNRTLLTAALVNLVQNAFKFTHRDTEVLITTRGVAERVLISVEDRCGGLPNGFTEQLFAPYTQRGDDRSGLGLGLSIARESVAAADGFLRVEDLPGCGCVFTIDLPRVNRSAA